MSCFGDYLSNASFWVPDRIVESAWIEHAPFAFWLVETLRPRMLVELGTHNGFSYFSFCQAVKNLGLNTSCYAVDTWKGDEHASFYGSEIFERVKEYHDQQFRGFSNLLQQTFDDAVEYFEDGSIDLLHLDGRHYYSDVSHDFETWKSKLSDRAIVIFHDTNVRESDFGVFRFWGELKDKYPHFEFLHGHGLGILGVGKDLPESLLSLFSESKNDVSAARIREAYSRLGGGLGDRHILMKSQEKNQKLQAKLAGTIKSQQVQITRMDADSHRLENEHTKLLAEHDELKTAEKKSIAQLLTLQTELASQIAENSRRISSVSWKLTSPFRGFSRRFPSFTAKTGAGSKVVHSMTARKHDRVIVAESTDELETIKASHLFDAVWYVQQNRDVLTAGMEPLEHYFRFGAAEGRNPNPLFDTRWYLEQNPSVAISKENPLLHYLREGWVNGRDPHPLFCGKSYLEQNRDVKQIGMNPLTHYLGWGVKEGRSVSPVRQEEAKQTWTEASGMIMPEGSDKMSPGADAEPRVHRFDLSVAAIFRDVAAYLKEWIEFHRLVGVQHFYLYNNLSGDNYLPVLRPYVQEGLVTIVDWPLPVESSEQFISVQLAAQQHALDLALGKTRWLAMIDTDEFLFPVTTDSLIDFLSDYEDFGGLCVNWQMFGTNNLAEFSPGTLLVESLTAAAKSDYFENLHVKSIVRPERVSAWSHPHFADYKPGFFQVNADRIRFEGVLSPYVSSDKIRLNHYWFRDEAFYRNARIQRARHFGLSDEALDQRYVDCNREDEFSIVRFVPSLRESFQSARMHGRIQAPIN